MNEILGTLSPLISIVGTILGAVLIIATLGFIGLKFYTLSSKEKAFVRTGAGSQKVVLNGGAFVIPGIHEIVEVNMRTLRLEVDKQGRESLITADRLRVDVKVEFYVRVKADEESVANAAQTLGRLTMAPPELKAQVEAKFVDALRAVAVKMPMYDLNAQRAQFVQQVQQVVAEDIAKNGLELESVSLTALNQTQKQFFDPSNAFDAEGLLVLTRETEARRKNVNDIEQDTAVAIETKNLEATRLQQSLRKQTEEVRLNTEQDIATLTANQQSAIAATEASARKDAESAKIAADREIQTNRIEANRVTEEANVQAKAAVTMRGQEQNILVANKSKDEAAAKALADEARAKAVAAEEAVETARQVEVANRNKQVTVVRAEEKAKESAISLVVAAEAEKEAATHKAEAARMDAQGERDASVLRAEGTIAEGNAIAEALVKKNQAQNELSAEQIALQVRLAVLAALPAIVEQSVKPLLNIDSIRIAEVGGLSGASSSNSANDAQSGGSGGGLSDQVVASALRYRTNAPVVDALLGEVGLKSGGDMSQLLAGALTSSFVAQEATAEPSAS
ncbi:flotillin family protein [Rhodoferax sp. TS-BS-61-7]|uniref:flotillin family protein n=1 Tax=Rhodoferax sp. TS-BS-61-7 TaxID=2094194 RepID=UPI000CF6D72E|nr:flotillin domain-containing protein [Rhodoferax sp. TS-BS-61-7]PQA77889.1 flotillin [Rhodoferax sp. TS-BS-61-7]